MLKNVFIVVVALIAAVLLYAGTRPDSFRVERQIRIAAPAGTVYGLVSDFHHWQAWSPWEKLDPALQRDYSGAAAGLGAVYAWKGNDAVGEGRMQIVEATSPTALGIQLDFLKPMASRNRADFTFSSDNGQTTVRWVMTGPSPYLMKLIGLFANFDQMIGKDFDQGLAELKRQAETAAAPAPPATGSAPESAS